jgi:hypothetical protein
VKSNFINIFLYWCLSHDYLKAVLKSEYGCKPTSLLATARNFQFFCVSRRSRVKTFLCSSRIYIHLFLFLFFSLIFSFVFITFCYFSNVPVDLFRYLLSLIMLNSLCCWFFLTFPLDFVLVLRGIATEYSLKLFKQWSTWFSRFVYTSNKKKSSTAHICFSSTLTVNSNSISIVLLGDLL